MGKRDIALLRYFEDEDRYADLINGFVFSGDQVISGSDILDKSAAATGVIHKLKDLFAFQKYRDAVRKVVLGTNFVVIGLEHQDAIHYAMPVRILIEDAAGYDEQMRRIQRKNRKLKGLQKGEFLGRFSKDDQLHAVFTIVLYYGEMPWDGPKDLSSLIDFGSVPEQLQNLFNNYRLHILEVRNFKNSDLFQTDLREVFGFISRSGDKLAEREFTLQNEETFEQLDEDAYDVISALTGSRELEEVKEKYREKGGKINMCEAIRGMIEDGKLEGKREGKLEGKLEKSQIIARNMFLRKMTPEDTAAICEEDLSLIQEWFDQWTSERKL